MNMKLLVTVCFLISAGFVYGHHSYGDFQRDLKVSVEGTVESFAFINPHAILTIKTADSQVYTLEWVTVTQLASRGVGRSTLLAGEKIVVTGSPKRRDEHYLSLLEEVRRPSDGWSWTRQR